jgi:hypothetical protein
MAAPSTVAVSSRSSAIQRASRRSALDAVKTGIGGQSNRAQRHPQAFSPSALFWRGAVFQGERGGILWWQRPSRGPRGAEGLLAKCFAHGMHGSIQLPTLVYPQGDAEGLAQMRDGAEQVGGVRRPGRRSFRCFSLARVW